MDQNALADAALLDTLPGYLSISNMLKATPFEEAGKRYVYIEASDETRDLQGEIVLAKALAESADYYLRYGNLDLDHYTQIGAKAGIPNYEAYEIGRPVEVTARDGATFVKGQIYSGGGAAGERANTFWSSLTEIDPPARWYPSVGGAIMEKGTTIDPKTMKKCAVIKQVRWTNIGFSKTPVNPSVGTVSTVPFGALAKSFVGGGWDLAKALEAGYGTDSAQLTGGAAMRKQSLEPALLSYWDFRDKFAGLIRTGEAGVGNVPAMVQDAQKKFRLSPDTAAAYVERFLSDLQSDLKRKQR